MTRPPYAYLHAGYAYARTAYACPGAGYAGARRGCAWRGRIPAAWPAADPRSRPASRRPPRQTIEVRHRGHAGRRDSAPQRKTVGFQGGSTMSAGDNSRIRELVQRAVSDPAFGRTILANPESAAAEYGLTTEQVSFINKLSEEGVLTSAVEGHAADINLTVY
jgi:hypothetical protein